MSVTNYLSKPREIPEERISLLNCGGSLNSSALFGCSETIQVKVKVKIKESRNRCGPEDSRRFRLQDFHDIRHMKVVRSPASRTGRLYPQEMFLVLIFTRG